MAADDWQRISALFHAARAKPPEEVTPFLDDACGDDGGLRARVEGLLAAERAAGHFGETPLYAGETLDSLLDHDSSMARSDAARRFETIPTTPGGRWPFLGFAAAAAAATIATFAYAAWLLIAACGSAPFYGWEAQPRDGTWIVSVVAADGPAAGALRVGDRLLAMNGTPPGPDTALVLHRRNLQPGDPYRLRIARDGIELELRLDVGTTSSAGRIVYFFVSLVWCAVGLMIGFARPDAVLARLACLTSLAVGFVFVQISVIESGLLWQPLHAVLGFHFLARFPTAAPTRGAWRAALVLAYAAGAFAAVLGLFSHVMTLAVGVDDALQFMLVYAPLFELRWPVGLSAFAVAIVGMALALVKNYRRLEDDDHRRRLRWVLYGGAVGLIPQLWWTTASLINSLSGAALPRLDLLANALTVAIPIAMAYAVVRHRVLDIRVVIRRSLKYLLARRALQVVVALPFMALLVILIRNRDLTLSQLATETAAYLVWLALGAAVLKFRQPIGAWLDHRFFREELDREQLVMQLLDESRRVESLPGLSQLISETLAGAMHPARAFVWYRDPRERLDTAASIPELSAADFPANEALLSWLEQHGRALSLPAFAEAGFSHEVLRWLEHHGIAVLVPLTDSGDRLVGALFLGSKKSEEPYDDRDSTLLDAIAKQAAVIHENLRLRARLNEEMRVRHDVLARLDGELPDLLKQCPDCGACFEGSVQHCPDDGASLVYALPVARTVDGRYRLDRLLGKGGMGAVYAACDLRLERQVAVKLMLSKQLQQRSTLRRFRREARATARLSHPNIVTVYDFGSLDDEIAYIVMERIRGETLRDLLDRERTLSPGAAREWFEPLLAGIAAAHENGIVHRDLKPENVMGHRNAGGTLEVKVLDLGLAKLRATEQYEVDTMTQEGMIMGTPNYMSPEQLLGREVDPRSDIFAIGVMLIEVLTGQRPRPGGIREGSGPALPTAALPAALRTLLASCLATEPDARPASARALGASLRPLLT